jgi:hypothetical protein
MRNYKGDVLEGEGDKVGNGRFEKSHRKDNHGKKLKAKCCGKRVT